MYKVKNKLLYLAILLVFPFAYAVYLVKSWLGLDKKHGIVINCLYGSKTGSDQTDH